MNASLLRFQRSAMQAISACAIFFLLAPSASAAVFFWAGGDGNSNNANNWENSANWSTSRTGNGGAGIPGAADKAVLTKGTGSHVVRIKSILSVGGIELNNLWTGSLLLGTGTLKVGTGGLRVGSGYFVAGANPLTISGSYTQTGGIVRGLQGNVSLSGSLNITTPGATPAYFTSTGTIIFSGYGNQTFTPLQRGKFQNVTLRNRSKNGTYSVIVATNNMALSGALTIATGKLDLTTNSLTLRTGSGVTVQNHASGSLTTNSAVSTSGSLSVGAITGLTVTGGTWTFNGQTTQRANLGGGKLWNVNLSNTNKAGNNKLIVTANPFNLSGALTIATGNLDLTTNSLGLRVGSGVSINNHASGALITNSAVSTSGSLSVGAITGLTVTGGTWTFNGQTTQRANLGGGKLWNVNLSNTNKAGNNKLIVTANPFNLSGALTIATGNLDLTTNSLGLRVGSGVSINNHASGALITNSAVSTSGSLSVGAITGLTVTGGTWTFNGQTTQRANLGGGKLWNVSLNNSNKAGVHSLIVTANPFNLSGALTIATGKLDLATNSLGLRMRGITINNHASGALVTDSNVTNSGSVTISGTSPTVTISGGTWTQNGTTNATLDFQNKRLNAFTLNNAGATSNKTETLGSSVNMSGALTITAGILSTSTSNYRMAVTGNVGITSTFNANDSDISVGGNWTTEAAGAFGQGGSTVNMIGTNKTMSGSTTFYKLNKTVSASDTLNFANGTTTRTTNLLTLNTSAGTLSLRSTVSGSRWNLTADANKYNVGTLDVKDSNATTTINCTGCTDSGNNSAGWVFSSSTSTSTSTGTSSGGGGGGGGGRAYLKVTTPAVPAKPAIPGVRPAIPATPAVPKAAITKKMTMKERLEARKQARAEFHARIKERAAKRKGGRK